jgi:hypothetical protein
MPELLLTAGAIGPAGGTPADGVRHCGQKAKLTPKGAPQFLQKLAIFAQNPGAANRRR